MPQTFDTIADRKIAYLILRKCGCTSILGAMKAIREQTTGEFDPVDLHGQMDSFARPSEIVPSDDWYCFTLVRDPIRRFLSFYTDKILCSSTCGDSTVRRSSRYGYWPFMCLDDAITVTIEGKHEPDEHVVPIVQTLNAVGFPLNHIGKLEEFQLTVDAIANAKGVVLQQLKLNPSRMTQVLPSKEQFERLANFYREDQQRFGYPDCYEKWCTANVQPNHEKWRQHKGCVFENEATLVRHSIEQSQDSIRLNLTWRVNELHSRARHVRVMRRMADGNVVQFTTPALDSLQSLESNQEGLTTDVVEIPRDRLNHIVDPQQLFLSIFFWSDARLAARLIHGENQFRLNVPIDSDWSSDS